LQRLVAIKVIPLSGAGEAQVIARFHQEGLYPRRRRTGVYNRLR